MTTAVFTSLMKSHSLSSDCTQYIIPAFCYVTFPLCAVDGHLAGDVRGPPLVRRLCKEDCLMLKNNYCRAEYSAIRRRAHSGLYFTADVSISMKTHRRTSGGTGGGLGWLQPSPLIRAKHFPGQSLIFRGQQPAAKGEKIIYCTH